MAKKRNSSSYNKECSQVIRLDECSYLGEDAFSTSYLMKNNRVVKIFKDPKVCKQLYNFLKFQDDNSYFPKIYEFCGHYLILEYIPGKAFTKYINLFGFSEGLAVNLIKLIVYLETKILDDVNIGIENIIVQNDEKLALLNVTFSDGSDLTCHQKVINELKNIQALDIFLEVLKKYDSDLYYAWTK